jgi:hypothetical protein
MESNTRRLRLMNFNSRQERQYWTTILLLLLSTNLDSHLLLYECMNIKCRYLLKMKKECKRRFARKLLSQIPRSQLRILLALSDHAACLAPSISGAKLLSETRRCCVPPIFVPHSGQFPSSVAPPHSPIQ